MFKHESILQGKDLFNYHAALIPLILGSFHTEKCITMCTSSLTSSYDRQKRQAGGIQRAGESPGRLQCEQRTQRKMNAFSLIKANDGLSFSI